MLMFIIDLSISLAKWCKRLDQNFDFLIEWNDEIFFFSFLSTFLLSSEQMEKRMPKIGENEEKFNFRAMIGNEIWSFMKIIEL